jgi:hypothetical protein
MRTLIKWIAIGTFGYLLYDMVTLLTSQRSKRIGSNKNRVGRTRQQVRRNPVNMTGFSAEGVSVPVEEPGGGSHTTKVGRGVL